MYSLNALITESTPSLIEAISEELDLIRVSLPQGKALFPLTPTWIQALNDKYGATMDEDEIGFDDLPEPVQNILLEFSKIGRIGFLSAVCFGGAGGQHAWVLADAKILFCEFKNSAGPINKALRKLGVKSAFFRDEFDTLGLGAKRSTEKWLK